MHAKNIGSPINTGAIAFTTGVVVNLVCGKRDYALGKRERFDVVVSHARGPSLMNCPIIFYGQVC